MEKFKKVIDEQLGESKIGDKFFKLEDEFDSWAKKTKKTIHQVDDAYDVLFNAQVKEMKKLLDDITLFNNDQF